MHNTKTCKSQRGVLTSLKLFLQAYFHNLPEEHALHNADSFSVSLCPVIQIKQNYAILSVLHVSVRNAINNSTVRKILILRSKGKKKKQSCVKNTSSLQCSVRV